MKWYLKVLKNYAVFRGRARRKEFWYFLLANAIAVVVLTTIDIALGGYGADARFVPLSMFYMFAVLIPAMAVTVRRLHDTGRSGR